jgi:hypothetical protein
MRNDFQQGRAASGCCALVDAALGKSAEFLVCLLLLPEGFLKEKPYLAAA